MATITGANHPLGLRQVHIGPYTDGNGNIYVVAEPSAATNRIGVYKSTDGGDTWGEIDSANRPTALSPTLKGFGSDFFGTTIYIASVSTQDTSGMAAVYHYEYHTFNTSDAGSGADTWQITNEAIYSPEIASLGFVGDPSVIVRSGPDVIVGCVISDASVMGSSSQRSGLLRREGGSWTTDIELDSTLQNQNGATLCLGSNDRVHALWRTFSVTNENRGKTLRPDNSLSTLVEWATTGNIDQPLSYNDGTFQHIIAGVYTNPPVITVNLVESSNDLAATGNSHTIDSDVVNQPATWGKAYDASNDETYWCYWDGGDDVVYYKTRTGEGAWGSATQLIAGLSFSPHQWFSFETSPSRIEYVYCDQASLSEQLYFDTLSLGAPAPEFDVELASESNVAEDVSFTDPNIFFPEPASERNIAADVVLEAGLGLTVEQAFEGTTAYDVEFFSGEQAPDGFTVFITSDTKIYTSEDGINWSERPQNATTRHLNDIGWSSGLDLILIGVNSASGTSDVLVSDDGFTWNLNQIDTITLSTDKIAWSSDEAIFAVTAGSRVYTSPDGTNWTQQTLARTSLLGDLIWVPELGLFVLGQDVFEATLTKGLQTSPDGVNWTAVGLETFNSYYAGLAWSPELPLLVAIDSVNEQVFTSPNGSSWTWRGDQNIGIKDVAWGSGPDIFVMTGNGGKVLTSSNGTSWTERSTSTTESLRDIEWIPYLDLFVVAGLNGTIITSPDGINWTTRTSPTSDHLLEVGFGVGVTDIFNAEFTTEGNTAFDVVFQNTTEIFADQATEANTAFDVELETDDVILIEETIELQLVMSVTLTVEEAQSAQGLGVPRQGDHKPTVYNPPRQLINR